MVKIELNIKEIKNMEDYIAKYPKKVEKAGKFAVNRTIEMLKTKAIKRATETYTVKRSDIAKSLKVRKSNGDNLESSFVSSGRLLGLDHFKLSPKRRTKARKEVKVSLLKSGGLKSLGNKTFIAYSDGRLGAFKRVKAKRDKRKKYALQRQMGLSAPQMIGSERNIEELEIFANEKLNERFVHELNRLL